MRKVVQSSLMLMVLLMLGIFIPATQAECDPVGTAGNDTIICDGTDYDGIDTNTGDDEVTIVGIVHGSIHSQGGSLYVLVDGGTFDTLMMLISAITADGGSVTFVGDINSGADGIYFSNAGSVDSTGNITAVLDGISIGDDGNVTSRGDIEVGRDGIWIFGEGVVDSQGNITAGSYAIWTADDANIVSVGDLTAGSSGIYVWRDAVIHSTGNITANDYGIYVEYHGEVYSAGDIISMYHSGINIGSGDVTSIGNITAAEDGIYILNDGNVNSTGNINAGELGISIQGYGDVTSVGDIIAGDVGIINGGNTHSTGNITAGSIGIMSLGNVTSIGNITVSSGVGILTITGNVISIGDITAQAMGIMMLDSGRVTSIGTISTEVGGILAVMGDQEVEVFGEIHAPVAVFLDAGNDSLYIAPRSIINGIIDMGEGDDIVRVGNYAVITQMILGGTGGEVDGDMLIIGGGELCAEDAAAVAEAAQLNSILDPAAGTITFLGQTYTWDEFEHVYGGDIYAVLCGNYGIRDGRINLYDLGAPDALYCTVENGVSVWSINLEGEGTFSFAVNADEIAAAVAAAVNSGVNQLIAEDGQGAQLYALSDGVNLTFVSPDLREAGKTYTFMFDNGTCA